MPFETISVIGLGYIGLPTAAMFASRKKQVIGIDVNQTTINTVNRGEIHIVEPDLDIIVHSAVTNGYLKATSLPEPADAFVIAVPTPFVNSDHTIPKPNLSYIQSAASLIAPVLKKGDLVILESTSPVGATEKLAGWLAKIRTDLSFPQQVGEKADVNIAHCPERVLPGQVIRELVENDRIIGGMSEICSKKAIELYEIFVKGNCITTNARTAEMAKLTENSCRDVQIAYANELSIICDKLDINVWELISLANRHPRINILQPGPGVGGHCIAVDPWFIVSENPKEARLIHTARKINDNKPEWVINKINSAVLDFLNANPQKVLRNVTIAFFGLAFKQDIDDLRESPAMAICKKIANNHPGRVMAVEPNISALSEHENIELVTFDEAETTANVSVLLVDHKEFKKRRPNTTHIIDTKGIW
jgi:UDP-N-acetyl-D-mannosaminuronic acid dehydrogenase